MSRLANDSSDYESWKQNYSSPRFLTANELLKQAETWHTLGNTELERKAWLAIAEHANSYAAIQPHNTDI